MPNPITLTYFHPYRLTFTGPIPPDTSLNTAIQLSSKMELPPDLGPLSDEAADAISTISSHLKDTGKEIVKRCDCSSLVKKTPLVQKAPSSSWALQHVFTRQRVVGWSAVLGGGYIMFKTLREGWKAKKEVETRGLSECEERADAGRRWWMVLGGGMYVAGVLVLGMRVEYAYN